MSDMVKSPKHYASILGEKLGIEVIDVANALELNGNRFSMLKYLCRAGLKDPAKEVEDLEKIIQYATFEIRRLKGEPISDTRRDKPELEGLVAQFADGSREKFSNTLEVCCYVLNLEGTRVYGPFTEAGCAKQYMRNNNLPNKTHTIVSGIIPPESPLHPLHAPKHMTPR